MAADLRERMANVPCHAPHQIEAEVGNVLRRRERAGLIPESVAVTALRALPVYVDRRYPCVGQLADMAWDLRGAITFYDALYAALAHRLKIPLVTCDGKLTRAPGLPCEFELLSVS